MPSLVPLHNFHKAPHNCGHRPLPLPLLPLALRGLEHRHFLKPLKLQRAVQAALEPLDVAIADPVRYTEKEIERVLRVGFELARRRRKKLTSVDKANVLESSRLWREIAVELSSQYTDVALESVLVDSCAMALVRNPSRFDVVVTENMFGDILTDEAAVLSGSLGMLPSASLAGIPREDTKGRRALGLYEPIHGSAPDIAGQGKANPIATILSVAMMLRYSLGSPQAASAVEDAVERVLDQGCRTPDIAEDGAREVMTTSEMGRRIVDAMVL